MTISHNIGIANKGKFSAISLIAFFSFISVVLILVGSLFKNSLNNQRNLYKDYIDTDGKITEIALEKGDYKCDVMYTIKTGEIIVSYFYTNNKNIKKDDIVDIKYNPNKPTDIYYYEPKSEASLDALSSCLVFFGATFLISTITITILIKV